MDAHASDSPRQTVTPPTLSTRLMRVLRVTWFLLAAGLVYLYGRGLAILLREPLTPCFGATICTPAQATAYIQKLGLNPSVVNSLVFVSIAVVIPLACVAVAVFLMWRASDRSLALATATTLLLYCLLIGSNVTSTGLGQFRFEATVGAAGLVLFTFALTYVLHTFPNGRFVPRWGRVAMLVEWLVIGGLSIATGLEGPVSALTLVVVTLLSMSLQVYRYRRAASATERQQLKWGLTGLLAFLVNGVLWIGWVLPTTSQGAGGLWAYYVFVPLSVVLVSSLPVSLAIAVLRYRLWDIDVLIRRTLIYSALTAVLTVAYFGLVIVLQALTGAVSGQSNSALVTVLSTLGIAALFAPVRGRVQNFVDRRFYRRKYDTAQTLAAFAIQARDEVNLDELSSELRGAVDEAMQPAHIGLWLR